MLTLEQFDARKNEFSAVSQAKREAALANAAARTDATIFGAYTDEAHMWLTAHLLANDPGGREALLKGGAAAGAAGPGTTIYLAERQRIEDLVGALQIGIV